MRSVLRSILGILLAFVVASAIMMVVESINGKVLYPELGKAAAGVTDQETIRRLMAAAPVGALLVVLAGWALGTIVGGFIAARVASRAAAGHALVFGGVIALAGIANNLMLPPPAWFWAAGIAVPVAAGCLVAQLVRPRA
jgi:hypothetical protein